MSSAVRPSASTLSTLAQCLSRNCAALGWFCCAATWSGDELSPSRALTLIDTALTRCVTRAVWPCLIARWSAVVRCASAPPSMSVFHDLRLAAPDAPLEPPSARPARAPPRPARCARRSPRRSGPCPLARRQEVGRRHRRREPSSTRCTASAAALLAAAAGGAVGARAAPAGCSLSASGRASSTISIASAGTPFVGLGHRGGGGLAEVAVVSVLLLHRRREGGLFQRPFTSGAVAISSTWPRSSAKMRKAPRACSLCFVMFSCSDLPLPLCCELGLAVLGSASQALGSSSAPRGGDQQAPLAGWPR